MMISIGTFNGQNDGYQFGIKGNGPDPATVSVSRGLVKYELVDLQVVDAQGQHFGGPTSRATAIHGQLRDEVQGVLLVQLLQDRVVKIETFPGKTASEVTEFTEQAKLYER